ncbi:hypothetical protein HID58_031414 [Brassica napus]|uniref:CS domain-containing protein n=1 Tax=Brassica napus TaxID=3708 RepID=A0ABQ8BUQ2_BRANA|nr:hypothetical protein HID58_031414 [Brassica napus]
MESIYYCDVCDFDLDLHCVKYPPPDVIDNFEMHPHKLTLVKKQTFFECSSKCGKTSGHTFGFTIGNTSGLSYGLSYKCDECCLSFFHVECVWHPAAIDHQPEVNHPYHSLHPLKLFKGPPPDYSDGKCRLCGRNVDKELFYHCSSCNFTLDWRCVVNPPPQSLMDLKAHDHQLTLLPRLDSFTCNACGLKGERSPYICVPCGFMIHQECLKLPRVININRHDHRVSRTSVLGDAAMNSVCGVCRKKVDWKYGGFSCKRCPSYVVHSKCATREDVWNRKELEGIPEEEGEEDIEPYVVIDDNTIQHFSHKDHHLRLHGNNILYEDNKRCSACTHPIGLHSFYRCMDCDFSLHQNCAKCPKKKRHVLHYERLTLVTNKDLKVFRCDACYRRSNGFMYKHGEEVEICNGCKNSKEDYLTVVADSKETKVNLDPEGVFDFSAKAGPENHVYELKLELHSKVNVEESKINIGVRNIFCIIEKAEPERWDKLIRGGKAPHYVKVDEDDEGNDGAADMDMGGMSGMDFSNFGGMGGMEGLGGMGGLGVMAGLEGLGGMGGMEEFEDSDDEEFAKPGDKKDEAVKEEAKPVGVLKEDK